MLHINSYFVRIRNPFFTLITYGDLLKYVIYRVDKDIPFTSFSDKHECLE